MGGMIFVVMYCLPWPRWQAHSLVSCSCLSVYHLFCHHNHFSFNNSAVESRHLFNEALKSGHVHSFNMVALLVGSVGSGKTCSKHAILNEQPPKVWVSTAIVEKPVKVVKVLTINGLYSCTGWPQCNRLKRFLLNYWQVKAEQRWT